LTRSILVGIAQEVSAFLLKNSTNVATKKAATNARRRLARAKAKLHAPRGA